ncbi:uncharacterized protein LOC102802700 [Saccoglossus kowalevskii]|uniref:Serine/arginine repetitive matrix protein 2-like n=1 Tax=Saccoglossus kowalevskii TaxID=10224 RepID=A0ABM0MWX3_SACKO|nr:PREDICTED: serine/arginine repetitive matrix protein 2-like [Saccoglossus kowalevskii]
MKQEKKIENKLDNTLSGDNASTTENAHIGDNSRTSDTSRASDNIHPFQPHQFKRKQCAKCFKSEAEHNDSSETVKTSVTAKIIDLKSFHVHSSSIENNEVNAASVIPKESNNGAAVTNNVPGSDQQRVANNLSATHGDQDNFIRGSKLRRQVPVTKKQEHNNLSLVKSKQRSEFWHGEDSCSENGSVIDNNEVVELLAYRFEPVNSTTAGPSTPKTNNTKTVSKHTPSKMSSMSNNILVSKPISTKAHVPPGQTESAAKLTSTVSLKKTNKSGIPVRKAEEPQVSEFQKVAQNLRPVSKIQPSTKAEEGITTFRVLSGNKGDSFDVEQRKKIIDSKSSFASDTLSKTAKTAFGSHKHDTLPKRLKEPSRPSVKPLAAEDRNNSDPELFQSLQSELKVVSVFNQEDTDNEVTSHSQAVTSSQISSEIYFGKSNKPNITSLRHYDAPAETEPNAPGNVVILNADGSVSHLNSSPPRVTSNSPNKSASKSKRPPSMFPSKEKASHHFAKPYSVVDINPSSNFVWPYKIVDIATHPPEKYPENENNQPPSLPKSQPPSDNFSPSRFPKPNFSFPDVGQNKSPSTSSSISPPPFPVILHEEKVTSPKERGYAKPSKVAIFIGNNDYDNLPGGANQADDNLNSAITVVTGYDNLDGMWPISEAEENKRAKSKREVEQEKAKRRSDELFQQIESNKSDGSKKNKEDTLAMGYERPVSVVSSSSSGIVKQKSTSDPDISEISSSGYDYLQQPVSPRSASDQSLVQSVSEEAEEDLPPSPRRRTSSMPDYAKVKKDTCDRRQRAKTVEVSPTHTEQAKMETRMKPKRAAPQPPQKSVSKENRALSPSRIPELKNRNRALSPSRNDVLNPPTRHPDATAESLPRYPPPLPPNSKNSGTSSNSRAGHHASSVQPQTNSSPGKAMHRARSPTRGTAQRTMSPNRGAIPRVSSEVPGTVQRVASPTREGKRTMSPNRGAMHRTTSPNRDTIASPVQCAVQRKMSPTRDAVMRRAPPTRGIAQRTASPPRGIAQRTASPTRDALQRTSSPSRPQSPPIMIPRHDITEEPSTYPSTPPKEEFIRHIPGLLADSPTRHSSSPPRTDPKNKLPKFSLKKLLGKRKEPETCSPEGTVNTAAVQRWLNQQPMMYLSDEEAAILELPALAIAAELALIEAEEAAADKSSRDSPMKPDSDASKKRQAPPPPPTVPAVLRQPHSSESTEGSPQLQKAYSLSPPTIRRLKEHHDSDPEATYQNTGKSRAEVMSPKKPNRRERNKTTGFEDLPSRRKAPEPPHQRRGDHIYDEIPYDKKRKAPSPPGKKSTPKKPPRKLSCEEVPIPPPRHRSYSSSDQVNYEAEANSSDEHVIVIEQKEVHLKSAMKHHDNHEKIEGSTPKRPVRIVAPSDEDETMEDEDDTLDPSYANLYAMLKQAAKLALRQGEQKRWSSSSDETSSSSPRTGKRPVPTPRPSAKTAETIDRALSPVMFAEDSSDDTESNSKANSSKLDESASTATLLGSISTQTTTLTGQWTRRIEQTGEINDLNLSTLKRMTTFWNVSQEGHLDVVDVCWNDLNLQSNDACYTSANTIMYPVIHCTYPDRLLAVQICTKAESEASFLHGVQICRSVVPHPNVLHVLSAFTDHVPESLLGIEPTSPKNGKVLEPGTSSPVGELVDTSIVLTSTVPNTHTDHYVKHSKELHEFLPDKYEHSVCLLLLQLLQGLHHLQLHCVTHGAIKLNNLLLMDSKLPGGGTRLVITNFDSAKQATESVDDALDDRSHEFETGLLIYEFLHEKSPFITKPLLITQDYSPSDLPPLPQLSCYSSGLNRLAGELLRRQPQDRLSSKNAICLLQSLLWGPSSHMMNGLQEVTFHKWLDLERAKAVNVIAEKHLGSLFCQEQGLSLEDQLRCQFLSETSVPDLMNSYKLLHN